MECDGPRSLGKLVTNGVGGYDRCLHSCKESNSGLIDWSCTFNKRYRYPIRLVSQSRTAWMGGFHLFADVAKYGRTYNRLVERSGDGKPSVGSNSQSVSINENVFQSFNRNAKAFLGQQSQWTCAAKYVQENAGAELWGLGRIVVDMLEGTLGFGWNSTSRINERCVWIDLVGLPLSSMGSRGFIRSLGGCLEAACYLICKGWTQFSWEFVSLQSLYIRKDQRVLVLDKVGKMRTIDVDKSVIQNSPKNDNMILCRLSSTVFARKAEVSIAWKRIWKKIREIHGVYSQGDCGNVTTDDNEDVTPVIAPEKDSIIAPPSTPPMVMI
ncbi:hypothetical protein Tco_1508390 [Tanacetum coccineum]